MNLQKLHHLSRMRIELDKLHAALISKILVHSNDVVHGGALTVDGQNLIAKVIGVTFEVAHRPILASDQFCAVEYTFITPFNNENLPVWRMYLGLQGQLFFDAKLEKEIVNFEENNLIHTIVMQIAEALMKSPVLTPAPVIAF